MDEPAGGGDPDLGMEGADLVGDFEGAMLGQDIQSDILSAETRDEILDIFSVFDRQNTGTVPEAKLRKMLRALNLDPNEQEYEGMLKLINSESRPHFIRLEDIFKIMEKRSKDADSIDDILNALKMFDKDNDGKITVREMRFALANMGNVMSAEEVDEFISVAASDDFILVDELAKTLSGK